MTIFFTPRLQREDMDVSEFGAGLGQSIGAAATEAVEEMPSVQLFGMREINEAQAKDQGTDLESAIQRVQQGADPADVMFGAPTRTRPEMLPMEARERVKEAGLDKQLTIPDGAMIQPSALDIMMERARHRQERAATIARGPQGVGTSALSGITSLFVGAVDPVNLAAAFIPVVGELRYAKMLEAAGESAFARAGVRAQVGAASGAVGMAAIEPIAAFAKTQEGQDYTMAMALRSVIFGAALGGILHTGGGAVADILRTRGERPLYPFDVGEPMEFHTPFDELRQPPAGSNLPILGAEARAQAERLPATFEEATRRLSDAGRTEPGEPAAGRPADTTGAPRPGEPPATPAEGGARGTPRGEAGPPASAAAERGLIPSPVVAMIDDLPPRAREDAMRAATAALIDGRPVQSGDIIAAGARHDPRIAESVAEGNAHAIATAAELTPHGRIVFNDMRGELKRAGMTDEEAAANAAIVAARYEARAARLEGAGGTAEDLYRAEGIRVQRGGVDDELGRSFAQRRRSQEGQTDLFGGARATDAEMAQRGANEPLRPGVAQKPMDEGLFGDTAAQSDLVDAAKGRQLFQPPTVPTFFSAVSRAIGAARQEKASPEQWLATLRNTPGVKQEELQWLGLPDWLKEQKGTVTRKDIQDYVRANNIEVREVTKGAGAAPRDPLSPAERREFDELVDAIHGYTEELSDAQRDRLQQLHDRDNGFGAEQEQRGEPATSDAKFSQWTLPGGENYRELLLTLPPDAAARRRADLTTAEARRLRETYGERYIREAPPEEIRRYEQMLDDEVTADRNNEFRSSHWDEPNVVAHIRFDDRVIDGKKTLFIEEIQSDLHQKGRREGYKQEDAVAREAAGRELDKADTELRFAEQRHRLGRGYVGANMPPEIHGLYSPEAIAEVQQALQRLRAAREAYAPYDMGSGRVPDAPFKTTWPELSFKRMIRYASDNGYEKIAWGRGEDHPTNPKRLGETGEQADAADRGMRGFYNDILPATVNKLVKKYGAKVEDATLGETAETHGWDIHSPGGGYQRTVYSAEEAEAARRAGMTAVDNGAPDTANKTVHAIDLTEPLRKAATEEGFPLFQREPGGEMRGRITLADNKAIIDLFSQSDRSTFMHETSHLWLDELARDAARANAPEGIRRDMETVLKWLGAERPDAITTEQHEKWAAAFEQYLATGKAPIEGLSAIFQQFKDWLTAIYKGIVGAGEPISDVIRAVMDRMIATPAQIEREAADRAATVHVGPRPARGPRARDPETFTLYEFLANRGGLRPDPELHAMFGGGNPFIPGFGKLVRKGGMGLDRAREAAMEAGYLHDAPAREAEAMGAMQGRPSESTERDLLDAMDRQARGEKVYREGREPKREHAFDPDEEMHRVESELNAAISDAGMQPHEISGKLRARTIEIMHREGERDPLAAYERAVMEESYNGAEIGKNERIPDHIPGWDTVSHDAGAAPAPGGPVETIRGPEATGTRQGPRGPGAGNRRAPGPAGEGSTADTWRRLADTPRDFNEPDVIAASKRADALPEPASTLPDKRLAAAQKADADAQALYDAQAEYLPADLKGKVEQDLRLLEQETLDTAEVVRRGAACLASAVVGAAV